MIGCTCLCCCVFFPGGGWGCCREELSAFRGGPGLRPGRVLGCLCARLLLFVLFFGGAIAPRSLFCAGYSFPLGLGGHCLRVFYGFCVACFFCAGGPSFVASLCGGLIYVLVFRKTVCLFWGALPPLDLLLCFVCAGLRGRCEIPGLCETFARCEAPGRCKILGRCATPFCQS